MYGFNINVESNKRYVIRGTLQPTNVVQRNTPQPHSYLISIGSKAFTKLDEENVYWSVEPGKAMMFDTDTPKQYHDLLNALTKVLLQPDSKHKPINIEVCEVEWSIKSPSTTNKRTVIQP